MLKWFLIFIGLALVSLRGQAQLPQLPQLIYEYEFADSFRSLDSVIGPSSVDLNPFACADTQFTFTVKGYMQVYRFDLIKEGLKNKGIITAYVYSIKDDEIKWSERKTANGAKVIRKKRWELQVNKTLLEKPFCDSLWDYALMLEMDSLPTDDELMNEVRYVQCGGIHFECEFVLNGVRKRYETNQLYIDSSKALMVFRPIRRLALDYLNSNPLVAVQHGPDACYNDRWSSAYICTGTIKQEVYEPLEIDWSDTFLGY